MASDGLTAQPLDAHRGLLWQFLVELLVSGILTVFFLFYFNRLFATLVSYAIRAYTWHNYRAYIDIQSLQISLLGGRIFWKDIRYHGHNQTILIHGGYITWRFWYRKVKGTELFCDGHATEKPCLADGTSVYSSPSRSRSRSVGKEEDGGKQKTKELPCRVSIKVSGMEVFLYNRSPAYDSIIENFARAMGANGAQKPAAAESPPSEQTIAETATSDKAHSALHRRNTSGSSSRSRHRRDGSKEEKPSARNESEDAYSAPEVPSFLRLFPVRIDCNKGAVIVGNECTPSILSVKFDKASGELSAAHAGPLDIYKQLFNFDFEHPVMHMKPNHDYKNPQLATAARLKKEGLESTGSETVRKEHRTVRRRRLWHPLQNLSSLFGGSTDSLANSRNTTRNRASTVQPAFPGQERWLGLTRYLDDDDHNEHDEWGGIEYAKFSLIADLPRLSMSFYWDVPGSVPKGPSIADRSPSVATLDINGTVPPDYGLDLQIHGGMINYGPWADRHRVILQNYFFPASCTDTVPAEPLNPGAARVNTVFKIFISFEEETVLRIPVREKSKDWKWKGRAQNVSGTGKSTETENVRSKGRKRAARNKKRETGATGQTVRPFGWLDILVESNSTVKYVMDMVAGPQGYRNSLDLDIRESKVFTSVNHDLLWKSGRLEMDCNLSNPLKWNELRRWAFNFRINDLQLFLLRDHMFLMTDLVNDWGSGPPPDFYTFTPYRYIMNLEFPNLKIFLNTNDSNIINNPAEIEDNQFIILQGRHLGATLEIPLDKFRPIENEISFRALGDHIGLDLSMPPGNTIATFVKEHHVADLGVLTLNGSYKYWSETSPGLTDRLSLDIGGNKLELALYGFLIRHFMKIKDNYFGEDMHFKTLEEYQEIPQSKAGDTPGEAPDQASSKSNDLDIILSVSAEKAEILLPANLYSAEDHVKVELPYANADLRFTSYYMDLMVDFSPLSLALNISHAKEDSGFDTNNRTQLFIDLVKIYGHRTFGLPPLEPTYVCNWDFEVGKITGECSDNFLGKLGAFGKCFAFSLDDDENALPILSPLLIHDVTFLRLRTSTIKIWLHIAQEALLLSTDAISVDFNDWAKSTFSQRLDVLIPNLVVASVDAKAALRQRSRISKSTIDTQAYLQTDIQLHMLKRKLHFSEDRRDQQSHLKESDMRTNRIPWLLLEDMEASEYTVPPSKIEPPAMAYPYLPPPLRGKSLLRRWSGTESMSSSGLSASSASVDTAPKARSRRRPASIHSVAASSLKYSIHANTPRPGHHKSDSRSTLSVRPPLLERRTTASIYSDALEGGEEIVGKIGQPRSSIALSSSLETPYFPLDGVELDVSDVPEIPTEAHGWHSAAPNSLVFNDVSTKTFDEDFVHTSFLLSFEPGVRALVTPNAVSTVVNLIDSLQDKHPEDILDTFQVDIMGKILDFQKRIDGIGTSTELSLRLPCFQLRFINNITADRTSAPGKDQYDLILDNLSVSLRQKNFPSESAVKKSTLAVHTVLKSLTVSVREKQANAAVSDVAVQAILTDMLLWLVTGKSVSVNVSFRGLEVANSSKKLQYLASLIHRSTLLADEIEAKFAAVSPKSERRLCYLAYALTTAGGDIPDPAFITRPSYALRAANNHLRNHDSWKIISRFRYIYDSLQPSVREEITQRCVEGLMCCPDDAEAKVIQIWDQWREWDLSHVKKSLAMRALYGSIADTEEATEEKPVPLDISVKTAGIRIVIDPGPEQSEILFQLLTINAALSPPPEPSGLMLLNQESPTKSTVVEISTRNVLVKFSWEICELVENVLTLFQAEAPHAKASKQEQDCSISEACSSKAAKPEVHDFQVLFTTEKGSISLDTINLRHVSSSYGMKISVAGSNRSAADEGTSISALVHSDAAGSELRSRGRLLMRSEVVRPSIFISHDDDEWRHPMPEGWMVVGKCEEVSWKVQEDILGIIEVANSIICDEVAYFARQVERFKKPGNAEPAASEPKKEPSLPNITVALLMDAYRIDVALLQSLTYVVSGQMGRVSAAPVLGGAPTLNVNFDLDRHTHYLKSHDKHGWQNIAAFTFPLHNGHLQLIDSPAGPKILFNSIMENFVIEASAVHGLLTTIQEPEVENVMKTIKEDIEVLQSNIKEALPKGDSAAVSPVSSEESRPVAFDASFVMTGMSIIARAPTKLPDSSASTLAFELNRIQGKASNISEDGSVLPLPEFSAALPHISMSLELSEGENIRHCGNLLFGLELRGTLQNSVSDMPRRDYRVRSTGLEINVFADTASAAVEVMNHLQERIKVLDLSRERRYLRKLRQPKRRPSHLANTINGDDDGSPSIASSGLFTSAASLELTNVQISWIVGNSVPAYPGRESEDLVLSFKRIDLATRSEEAARLAIEDMQLQMVPSSQPKTQRSLNSALLPEVVFNVSYASSKTDRRFAFHAAGKSLDLLLESRFVLPASILERSISLASQKVQAATASWKTVATPNEAPRKSLFNNKKLSSLIVDADFAGAVVTLQGKREMSRTNSRLTNGRYPQYGRYGQFASDGSNTSTTLRAPGISLKVEYRDDSLDPSLNAEVKVNASSNLLHPTVVPLIMDISNSIKEVVQDKDKDQKPKKPIEPKPSQKFLDEESLITADPSAILGKTRLNMGLRICQQEFSLSCQPIARVAATARFEDIYLTVNSIKSTEQGHFFAVSSTFDNLQASVQHVYSRESTFSFDVDRIVLSVLNSKHLSGTSGISAILKINPMRTHINARQLQDFLLFREIWVPPEVRQAASSKAAPAPNPPPSDESPQEYLVQRYQQVAAAAAFPWNATIAIEEMAVDLDMGQAIGKPSFKIVNLWASSKKTSDWEQNLCVGIDRVGIESTGRTSGFVELLDFKVRTSISWPSSSKQQQGGEAPARKTTPLIQASMGFERLRVKAAFDYQPFAVADITAFSFLMYNVRGGSGGGTDAGGSGAQQQQHQDRLVATLEGDRVQAFMTPVSPAQAIALMQAVERLVQENQTAYQQSLKDIEKFLRRSSTNNNNINKQRRTSLEEMSSSQKPDASGDDDNDKQQKKKQREAPISLHTDVVVTLNSISVGAFPGAFSDQQILLLTASDVQARFAAALDDSDDDNRIHSGLGMTLGQLSVALASIGAPPRGPARAVSELTVEDVVGAASAAKGGTILRVPKVIATMQTWQAPGSNAIDYIFKSSFEGKVDVGWNYSRISFIRNMWNTHSRALANRLGKPLPESAVKITTGADGEGGGGGASSAAGAAKGAAEGANGTDEAAAGGAGGGGGKITAVVNVPQSRYEYTALEPPVIETPQLRDMGEATPPLEWIGLQRDRLPNVTHQIVIVTLLEIVKEVEDAYGRILGSS
ncbi:Fermentation associated protein [Lasiodiplodia theobromae]|uniref:Fermentation associated protein n=1 Tax=Lasiodiplodia theobromae TaxID=45133 RepID=UPI0015C32F7B|nr:Fermentation associated protein [Lasiodiplodia theobromae]KAF4533812.1 Fermentation associated protein [Lasiodiplodia theobromae]